MKIFITGATGLVGANTALELLRAGHQLRLLVRNQKAAEAYFSQRGFDAIEYVQADMTDKSAIKKNLEGCEAVFHCAALVSLDKSLADKIYQNNLQGIDSVLGSAHELGIKNILYVSSLSVFFQPGISSIHEKTPLASTPNDAYVKSKIACEKKVREMQAQGAPIQITYPGGVYGPDDPKLNESNKSILAFLNIIPRTSAGIQGIDARDLAKIHRYLLEHPKTDNFEDARYIAAGRFYPWKELHAVINKATGRNIFSPYIPGALLRAFGHIMDIVTLFIKIDIAISREAMDIVTKWVPASSDKILNEANLSFRSGEEMFRDTIAYLVHEGHVDKKKAGTAI